MRKTDPITDPEKMTTSSLLEWLSAGNGSDRSTAAEELGARGIASSWRPLCRLLRDPYWVARCSAAESLGIIGARMAVPFLRRALKTLNPIVKGYVSEALAVLDDTGSRPAFEKMRNSRNPLIRMRGAAALYILGDSERLMEVIEAVTARNDQNQRSASNTLWGITRPEDAPRAIAGLKKALAVEKNPALVADFRRAIRKLRQL